MPRLLHRAAWDPLRCCLDAASHLLSLAELQKVRAAALAHSFSSSSGSLSVWSQFYPFLKRSSKWRRKGAYHVWESEPELLGSRRPGDVGMFLFSKFKWSHLPTGCYLLEIWSDSEEGWWGGGEEREGRGSVRGSTRTQSDG